MGLMFGGAHQLPMVRNLILHVSVLSFLAAPGLGTVLSLPTPRIPSTIKRGGNSC